QSSNKLGEFKKTTFMTSILLKKIHFLTALFLFLSFIGKSATIIFDENVDCKNPENIYYGSPYLDSQADVDNFGSNGYTEITGTLQITSSYITSLAPLGTLEVIGADFMLNNTPNLSSTEGLHNINTIGGYVQIYNSPLNFQND